MHTKTLIILLLVFAFGFAAGIFSAGFFVRKHVHRMKKMRNVEGFQQHLGHVLDLNPAQQEELMPIVAEYGEQIELVMKEAFGQRRVALDSLQLALQPHLSDEQQERLKHFMERHKMPGPPPPPPPPGHPSHEGGHSPVRD